MLASAIHDFSATRIYLAALAAITALTMSGTSAFAAPSVHGKEKSRVPVVYHAKSNCSGPSPLCGASFGTTPGGNKRLQVVGLSCWTRNQPGVLYLAKLIGSGINTYEYLQPHLSGTYLNLMHYVVTSDKRYYVKKNEELAIALFSSSEVVDVHCTLLGELVTYK